MKLVEEYRQSGLQQKEFCAKHNVSLSTLQFWLYRRSKRTSGSESGSRPAFLPLEVVASPAPQAPVGSLIEATTRSGVSVRFTVGTDPSYVAALLAALSSP